MSFAVHARRVRDESLPAARRGSALSSAIVLYRPFGFTWTHRTLSRFGDLRRDPGAMLRALEVLERGRNARTAEREAFARRRYVEKHAEHRRTPRAADRARADAPRWAGPDLHREHRALVVLLSCRPATPAEEAAVAGLRDWERAVGPHVDAYLATDGADPEPARALGGLLPELSAFADRVRAPGERASRLTGRPDRLRMTAALVHWDRSPEHPTPW
ncbi:hypothetical protein ACN20G_27790 (plasmid) [Streptomyces sp. BI20]|uniref:hypothetical protein n=1 Tax=Streptomyces sp. BI20 TaxID=3403460 RepID=UPI003C71EE14